MVIKRGGSPAQNEDCKSGLHHRSAEGKVYTENYKVVLMLEGISLNVGDVVSEDGQCRTCRVTAKPANNGYLTACSKPAV